MMRYLVWVTLPGVCSWKSATRVAENMMEAVLAVKGAISDGELFSIQDSGGNIHVFPLSLLERCVISVVVREEAAWS